MSLASLLLLAILTLATRASAPDPGLSQACMTVLGRNASEQTSLSARLVHPIPGQSVSGDAIRVEFSSLGEHAGMIGQRFPPGVVAALLLDGALVAYDVQLDVPLILANPRRGQQSTLTLAAVSNTGSATWKTDKALCVIDLVSFQNDAIQREEPNSSDGEAASFSFVSPANHTRCAYSTSPPVASISDRWRPR